MGGGAPGAIQTSEIIAYLREFGPRDTEEREEWLHLVQEADAEWMDATNAKLKGEQESRRGAQRAPSFRR